MTMLRQSHYRQQLGPALEHRLQRRRHIDDRLQKLWLVRVASAHRPQHRLGRTGERKGSSIFVLRCVPQRGASVAVNQKLCAHACLLAPQGGLP